MTALDSILPEMYLKFNTPADRITTDPDLADRFVRLVNERVAAESAIVLRRLITLRKKGLLPRLRR